MSTSLMLSVLHVSLMSVEKSVSSGCYIFKILYDHSARSGQMSGTIPCDAK